MLKFSDHLAMCVCAARQYMCQGPQGLILHRRGPPNVLIRDHYNQDIYNACFKHLSHIKVPCPNNIPNEISKSPAQTFHTMLFHFFQQCYTHTKIPNTWKHIKTIMFHKKFDPMLQPSYRFIALTCTIFKLYTSTLTTLLSTFGETHKIFHQSQEGFRAQRNTYHHIQIILTALEDTQLTKIDIFITYTDFGNVFGSIDHAWLLAIMLNLGYPNDVVAIIGNLHTYATTSFHGVAFGSTQPIHIHKGTIQGDTLSPYLFLIFLKPLLRWFE